MNKKLCWTAFFAGLAAVAWVGAGYVGASPLALAMTALIGAVYGVGASELRRFDQATASLTRALAELPADLPELCPWLGRIHPSLQNAVRLRVEGERVGLPGPAVTPYLVGLLVLLGMLGTFLGMVVTLNGAVLALESTTDLHTIRAALAAPVKGLGLAFGTSVAGVAASAMLGLISSLCRRERLLAGQLLDSRIATTLRGFSLTHQRQETFKALQGQAQALPAVVEQLQAMMAQMEAHHRALGERLLAGQEGFYAEARGAYGELAASVDRSLNASLSASARLAGQTIQPVVEATMAGIARETAALHAGVAATVQTQLDGVAQRFAATAASVTEGWQAALGHQQLTGERQAASTEAALASYAATFEQRTAALLASVEAAHATRQSELVATTAALAKDTAALHDTLAATAEARFTTLAERFNATAESVADTWRTALAKHEGTSDRVAAEWQAALAGFAETFALRAEALLATVGAAHTALRVELAAGDRERQTALATALEAMAAGLRQEWQAAGAQTLAQQQGICHTLRETATAISADSKAQASGTIAEVSRLMQTAAEAPKAAAEVIGQLRQELSASIARDNTLLEERSRIMETLGALLDAINHASTEQRGAIDALVASAATLLERAGGRLEERLEAESARLDSVAAQITGSAAEVASLGEAFGLAVERFSDSNNQLMTALERIESALGKTLARSDDQLAYYVAQAREIIDLSILSQKRMVDDLQELSGRQPALAAAA
ncbi:MAG: DUF802 domain-containing protein [Dechloromonas sp.]|jgi:uncharacterized coiled-coil protein SlyX|nr:DUF802 domain-containing protein [Dechloromonas sp.]